ncbi:sporulation protein [Limnohabitans sp. 2KL-1]|uniref:SPOR domain-containing protein n=1 Tax=Limnohabitans sp. 2KL-1 TaxID=1100699 RepID=UPI000D33AA7F|nr:SPOR domain-containing protein [Limnohabitans sp. 2KL-1]PUE45687.1 sporulation protein [Limnohabitans sp. 2KL-1]
MTLKSQRGGTFLGFIIGLVLGLAVALAVAIYVTKVPTPFSNKNQPRSSAQDVQESQKNKDWNPNGVLQPKAPAEAPALPEPKAAALDDKPKEKTAEKALDKPPSEPARPEPRPAVTADPLGELAKSKSALATPATPSSASDPFDYVIQAGAYRTNADADAQKAKLALMGLDARVSERDQAGRIVYRVRLGPFEDKNVAERIRTKLEASGVENTLVRVQR